jgi:hypothetical protein
VLKILVQFFNIEHGGIKITLDGESALNSAKKSTNYLYIKQSCYDILQDIHNRIKTLKQH